jgi:hypothetical protein
MKSVFAIMLATLSLSSFSQVEVSKVPEVIGVGSAITLLGSGYTTMKLAEKVSATNKIQDSLLSSTGNGREIPLAEIKTAVKKIEKGDLVHLRLINRSTNSVSSLKLRVKDINEFKSSLDSILKNHQLESLSRTPKDLARKAVKLEKIANKTAALSVVSFVTTIIAPDIPASVKRSTNRLDHTDRSSLTDKSLENSTRQISSTKAMGL